MAWIRIGYFEDWGGDRTLLIAGDGEGFRRLTRVFHESSDVPHQSVDAASISDVTVCGAITVILETSPTDEGLQICGAGHFLWRRSPDGWTRLAEELAVLTSASSDGRRYLDGPADEIQVVAAIGEYGHE